MRRWRLFSSTAFSQWMLQLLKDAEDTCVNILFIISSDWFNRWCCHYYNGQHFKAKITGHYFHLTFTSLKKQTPGTWNRIWNVRYHWKKTERLIAHKSRAQSHFSVQCVNYFFEPLSRQTIIDFRSLQSRKCLLWSIWNHMTLTLPLHLIIYDLNEKSLSKPGLVSFKEGESNNMAAVIETTELIQCKELFQMYVLKCIPLPSSNEQRPNLSWFLKKLYLLTHLWGNLYSK